MGNFNELSLDNETLAFLEETGIPAIEVLHRVERLESLVQEKLDRLTYYKESPTGETLEEILREIDWVKDLTKS